MRIHLDPNFEDFFVECLLSYFEILKKDLKFGNINEMINETFFRYVNYSSIKMKEVLRIKDNFLESERNRRLLKEVEDSIIFPIYYNFFGSDYINAITPIITSAINLFFKIALEFNKNINELFVE